MWMLYRSVKRILTNLSERIKKITIVPTLRAQKTSKVEWKAFLAIIISTIEFFFDESFYPDENSGSSCFEVTRNDVEQLEERILKQLEKQENPKPIKKAKE